MSITKITDKTIRLAERLLAFDCNERLDRNLVGVVYGTTPEEAVALCKAQNMKQRGILQERIRRLEAEHDRDIINPWTAR